MRELFDDSPHAHVPEELPPPGTVVFEAPYGLQKQCPECYHEMTLIAVHVSDTAEVKWIYECPIHADQWVVRTLP